MIEIQPTDENNIQGILRTYPNTFDIQASSISANDRNINYILNENITSYWCSNNEKWQNFTITFNNFYVSLTSYTVQAGDWNGDANFPLEWTVSAEIDNEWINISNVVNSEITSTLVSKTFPTIPNANFYNKIAVIHTGLNTVGKNYFCIKNFDIFGKISRFSHFNQKTCIKFSHITYYCTIFVYPLCI